MVVTKLMTSVVAVTAVVGRTCRLSLYSESGQRVCANNTVKIEKSELSSEESYAEDMKLTGRDGHDLNMYNEVS
jgi:hypothetical protein